ncbi:MAG: Vitamin B12-binding protein [Phycisphaerae bacterium]|nr:Vitamin B12-binding protein [Phycisphaerae bacterium]
MTARTGHSLKCPSRRRLLEVLLFAGLLGFSGGCRRPAPVGGADAGSLAAALPDYVAHPRPVPGEEAPVALRIVSLAPNVTEICCALGQRDALVGRTSYCLHPPGIERIPALGALIDTNVEALVSLKPDLVIVSGDSRAISERLSQIGIPFEAIPDVGLTDLYASIERVGTLLGRPRSAKALAAALRADVERVIARYRGTPRRRVLLVTGTLTDPPEPPYVAGSGSFYAELIGLLGHDIALPDAPRSFAPLSLETIIAADPDVIVELDPDGRSRPRGDADALRAWSRLGQLAAVRARRVHVLIGPQHYVAGPRIAQTLAQLSEKIVGPAAP